MKLFRRLTRAIAAIAFWLHAVFIVQIAPPSVTAIAERLHLQSAETVLLIVIGCLSVIGAHGWRKVLFDVAYIYLFPFIAVYRVAAVFSKLLLRRGILETPAAARDHAPLGNRTRNSFAGSVARPFTRFSLLWGVLLVVASWPSIVWISFVVVIIHLVRALVWCLRRLWRWHGLLSDLKTQLSEQVDAVIDKIMAVREGAEDGEIRRVVFTYAGLQGAVNFLKDRGRATQLLFALSLLVAISGHIYLACLFSFAYHGLARVQLIEYPWGESFVTALFMPLMIGELPANVWIRGLGGIHGTLILAGGVTAGLGYVERRVDSVYVAINDLEHRLNNRALARRVAKLNEKLKKAGRGRTPSLPR